jgi:hypothetical protein
MSEYRSLMRIFGPARHELSGICKKFFKKELENLCPSPNNVY